MHSWFGESPYSASCPTQTSRPYEDSRVWKNSRGMSQLAADARTRQGETAGIAAMIVLLGVVTWFVPPEMVEMHNILHHLNFLPLMIAGMLFGWRGALYALLLAACIDTPSVLRHWISWPLDAQDQLVELSIFGVAGLIAGVLSDRERVQRRRVEVTKLELEQVYVELRDNIEQMKKSERLSAAGELAASLAHEIRNPLASISGAVGILKRGNASQENELECLTILEKESQRLNKLLTNFLDFARPRLPRYQRVDAGAIITSVAALARHAATLQQVEIRLEVQPDLPQIECDAEQLKQVLLNLVINAVQASDSHGAVVIRCVMFEGAIAIEVQDEGSGIPLGLEDRVFDPFFTTKEGGTGLGLAVAANIVEQHGGQLKCANNDGRGTTFHLELPLNRPQRMRRELVVR